MNMLPQTSSSQFFDESMNVSAFTVAILPLLAADALLTRLSKSTAPPSDGAALPLAVCADLSSIRCESRKY